MDIQDKYLGVWITREELETIFSLQPASTAARFLIAGTVVGDTPGIGVWLQLDTVATFGERDIFPDIAKEHPCRLIRWDYIHAAEMFDDKTELERAVGFRPSLVI
jgi:hypothetical protein